MLNCWTPAERSAIEAAMAQTEQALGSTDAAQLEAFSKTLALATESFAAARMNHGIARALAGKNIETL